MGDDEAAREAGWLMSAMANGTVFRVPLLHSQQLVDLADTGVIVEEDNLTIGVPWEESAGVDEVLFHENIGWAYEGGVPIVGSALEGAVDMVLDLSGLQQALKRGHVIGVADRAYKVMAIDYDGDDLASIRISPPLRTSVVDGQFFTFAPTMLVRVMSADSFRAAFEYGFMLKPGDITLVEALI
jgi:hypothetical protein